MRVLIGGGASFDASRLARRYIVDRDEVTDQGKRNPAYAGPLQDTDHHESLPTSSLNVHRPDC